MITKINDNCYRIEDITVHRGSETWNRTVDRIKEAKKKTNSKEEFHKKMITRLKRIKHKRKLCYAVVVLSHYGYEELSDIYAARLVMESLLDD